MKEPKIKKSKFSNFDLGVMYFLKIIFNFNEAVLTAEIAQTLYKFVDVDIWSTTIIWFIPSIAYVAISGIVRRFIFSNSICFRFKKRVFLIFILLLNYFSYLLIFIYENLIIHNYSEKTFAFNFILAILAFTIIDVSTKIYNNIFFEELIVYSSSKIAHGLEVNGMIFEVIGKLIAAFVSGLYVILKRTDMPDFLPAFQTNIMFSYFVAMLFNGAAVITVMAYFPKSVELLNHYSYKSSFELLTKTVKDYQQFSGKTKRMITGAFLIFGIYWTAATSITQWVSFLFIDLYPVDKGYHMEVLDIGTAWGSLSLFIFYATYGLSSILMLQFRKSLQKYGKLISVFINFLGFGIYLLSFLAYERNVKFFITVVGFGGCMFDMLFIRSMLKKVQRETVLKGDSKVQREYKALQIFDLVEFFSETVFFLLLPVILQFLDDKYWVILLGVIYLLIIFVSKVPITEEQFQQLE